MNSVRRSRIVSRSSLASTVRTVPQRITPPPGRCAERRAPGSARRCGRRSRPPSPPPPAVPPARIPTRSASSSTSLMWCVREQDGASAAPRIRHEVVDRLPAQHVQPQRGLVQHQRGRIVHGCAGDAHPLPLAGGEPPAQPVRELADAEPLHHRLHAPRPARARPPPAAARSSAAARGRSGARTAPWTRPGSPAAAAPPAAACARRSRRCGRCPPWAPGAWPGSAGRWSCPRRWRPSSAYTSPGATRSDSPRTATNPP